MKMKKAQDYDRRIRKDQQNVDKIELQELLGKRVAFALYNV
jgi:hypothetical protein